LLLLLICRLTEVTEEAATAKRVLLLGLLLSATKQRVVGGLRLTDTPKESSPSVGLLSGLLVVLTKEG